MKMPLSQAFKLLFSQQVSEVKALTLPLQDIGINFFCYTEIVQKVNVLSLLDYGEFGEFYLTNQCYQFDPFLSNSTQFISGFYTWDSIFTSTRQQQFLQDNKDFNICHGCTIIDSSNEATQPKKAYHFGMPNDSARSVNFFINNYDLLLAFISYFNDKAKQLIKESPKISLPNSLPIVNQSCFQKDHLSDLERESFLQSIEFDKNKLNNFFDQYQFSNRQRQCTHLILTGKSAKQIANELSLSTRTVEAYIKEIKSKTACRTVLQLVLKALSVTSCKHNSGMV